MRVQALKCHFTGKLFDMSDRKKYISHLKNLRKEKQAVRHTEALKNKFWNWLAEEKLKVTHPSMIPEWFLENQQIIMDACNAGLRSNSMTFSRDKFKENDKFVDVRFDHISPFKDLVSNSHSCPEGMVTNFSRKEATPTGYPGWPVRVSGCLYRNRKDMGSYPYSDALNLVGIKTGSGGGGNEAWSHDARVFLDDWPGLRTEYNIIMLQRYEDEKEQIVGRLKGKR